MYTAKEWQNRPPDGFSEEWVFEPDWEDRIQLSWDDGLGVWVAQTTLGTRARIPLIKNGALNTDFWNVQNQSVTTSVITNPDGDEELLVEVPNDNAEYYLQLTTPFMVANTAVVKLSQRGNGWSGSTNSGNVKSGPFIGETFDLPLNGGSAQSAAFLMNRRDEATESYSRHLFWDPAGSASSSNNGNTSTTNSEDWQVGSQRPDHDGSDRELRIWDSTGNSASTTQSDPPVSKVVGATVTTSGYDAGDISGWYWQDFAIWI